LSIFNNISLIIRSNLLQSALHQEPQSP